MTNISSRLKSKHNRNKNETNNEIYKQIKKEEKEAAANRMSYLETISNHILLPADVSAGMPYITICGRSSVLVENHKKILLYSDKIIKIQVKACNIKIEGEALNIAYYTKEELKICGVIKSVAYE